jgi:hypothetical protein
MAFSPIQFAKSFPIRYPLSGLLFVLTVRKLESDVTNVFVLTQRQSQMSPMFVLTKRQSLTRTTQPGVDSNVSLSAWSRPRLLSVVAVHTAISPGFCTPTRRFQDEPSQGGSFVFRGM